MPMKSKPPKSPLDKVLGRIDDLDEVNLGILVQRLARERKLLETVFDVIRDGILVLDEDGLLTYSNSQGRRLIGLKEGKSEKLFLHRAAPELARALGLGRNKAEPRPEVVVREFPTRSLGKSGFMRFPSKIPQPFRTKTPKTKSDWRW